MEKIVATSAEHKLWDYDFDKINEYLEDGWTVKSVVPVTRDEYISVIVVLEK
jgi:hypothetical protein